MTAGEAARPGCTTAYISQGKTTVRQLPVPNDGLKHDGGQPDRVHQVYDGIRQSGEDLRHIGGSVLTTYRSVSAGGRIVCPGCRRQKPSRGSPTACLRAKPDSPST
ncbi:hypothetical protein ABEX47_28695 [Paenibacillus ehimensis]|uniref:hypothetical protein n=1 Tax=Paenibacillus ehimensis TaxID=79264 RepID=UPI000FDCBC35|nr:hypothetical protein [Paenibacillus ehimensis]